MSLQIWKIHYKDLILLNNLCYPCQDMQKHGE